MRWGSSVRPGEGSNVLTSTYRRRWSNLRDYFNDGSDGMVLALLQALLASKRDMKQSRTQNGTESDDVAGNMRMTDRLAIFLTNNIFRNQEARWCRQQAPSDVYFYGYRTENYWKTSDASVNTRTNESQSKAFRLGVSLPWFVLIIVFIYFWKVSELREIRVCLALNRTDLLGFIVMLSILILCLSVFMFCVFCVT